MPMGTPTVAPTYMPTLAPTLSSTASPDCVSHASLCLATKNRIQVIFSLLLIPILWTARWYVLFLPARIALTPIESAQPCAIWL